jgi:predicted MPP superfamily phosphohydrolase
VLDPEWSLQISNAIYGAMAFGFSSLVLQGITRRRLGLVASTLSWVAYIWLGFLFYLIIAAIAFELPSLFAAVALPRFTDANFLPLARLRALGIMITALVFSAVALRSGLCPPTLEKIEIVLDDWPVGLDGFRIVQISDVHIGPLLDREFSKSITARVNALVPDLVAVTGDLVDGSAKTLNEEVLPFRELRATKGVYFVTGNHDFYSGADNWVTLLEGFGWHALRNRRVTIEVEGASFELAGVDDRNGAMIQGSGGEDLELATRDWQADSPLVLLAHDPGTFHRAHARGVDLQLSGHTHGGQIWPFGWLVRASVPWVKGLHRVAKSQLYVSCGTGFWGPPMRLGTASEITELTLRTGSGRRSATPGA